MQDYGPKDGPRLPFELNERYMSPNISYQSKLANSIDQSPCTLDSIEREAAGIELTQSELFDTISRLGSEGSFGDLGWV
jgi:hypothetical protein